MIVEKLHSVMVKKKKKSYNTQIEEIESCVSGYYSSMNLKIYLVSLVL